MDIDQAIRTRVSVKEYTDHPVPRAVVEQLLGLAMLAPNHRMTEPLEFRVMGDGAKRAYAMALAMRKSARIDDPDAAAQVRDRVVSRTTAVPAMIGVVVRQDPDPEIREEDYATAFMAIQNLCLGALERGLGTHIKTGAVMNQPELRQALDVAEDQRLVAIVFLGEPAEWPDPKSDIGRAKNAMAGVEIVETYRFTLFIAGESPRSTRALENLRNLGAGALDGAYELEVVDVTQDAAAAEENHIMATPTLIKHAPDPVRRVTGDLSDPDAVALALGLPR